MRDTLRKATRLIGPGEWRRWALLVVLAVLVSGLEMVGAGLVFALISLVSAPDTAIDLPLIGDVTRFVDDPQDETFLLGMVAALAIFFLVRAVVRVGTVYAQGRIAHNAGARLSNRLVAGYLNAPYEFHLHRNSAELIRNAHNAVTSVVNEIYLPVIRIAAESILVVALLALMVWVAPTATLLSVAVIGAASVLLLLVVQPRIKRVGRIVHDTSGETIGVLKQGLDGIRDIKVLGRERWFNRTYARSRRRMAHAYYMRSVFTEIPRTTIELALLGFILIFFAVTVMSGTSTAETLSVLGLFAYAGLRLQPSIQRILGGLNSLKFAAAPLDDLAADLATMDSHSPPVARPADRLPFERELRLEEVEFQYQGAASEALRKVDLIIRQGEQVGICGPTGGGKTTLVDLISGLLVPTKGRITVDDVDIFDHTRSWQQNLGVVPQDVFLIDDTLRRNVAFGIAERDVDDAAIAEAIDLAQLREFVDSLPDGLETRVGEKGIRISGGQRQRIAIARALYRHPEVLIFDEGTSALDNTTETALMQDIERLRGEHTIILVAHRLSTVRHSDQIAFVERGEITARGTYEELMEHQTFRVMAEG